MRNLSMFTPFFFFFLLCRTSIATSTTPYIAGDIINLDCGSSGYSTDGDGRVWIGDINSEFASIEEPNHNSSFSIADAEYKRDAVRNTVPYRTARVSSSPFAYNFRVTPGPKFVRLYFHVNHDAVFDYFVANFTVKAGSLTLLRDFNGYEPTQTGGNLCKEFCIKVEEKTLNISFIPFQRNSGEFYAFVNGIEIVSMPKDLYMDLDLSYVGQPSVFPVYMAAEKVIRLNMGGGYIHPGEDTGMFREWETYIDYRWVADEVIAINNSYIKPIYSKIPNYTAPDNVYKTAVLSNSTIYLFIQVEYGFDYLVRLHFCEIRLEVTSVGERPFFIDINGQIADHSADVLLWSERKETPVYKDFVVRLTDTNNLYVSLSPGDILNGTDVSRSPQAILNGMEVFKLINSAPQAQKVALEANESKKKQTIIIAVGSGVSILVVLTVACGIVLWKLRKTKLNASYCPLSKCWCWPEPSKGKARRTKASSLSGELCRHFTLEEIKRATQNFHEELIIGVGGFGNVYEGVIDEGTTTMAIKRLNPDSKQGLREFRTEIEMLSQLRHVNLVSLIGYCCDEGEMILVYEYLTNGTLRNHLYETHNDRLSWKQRLQICVGAARGLDYLHTGVNQPIIHRDVKTTNILLDDNWGAKVSDFGLSKMGRENTAVSTLVKGTWGYLDPDYARRRQLTDRSDVYSFGVVLFEVLCARKALDHKLETEQWHLANWARECIDRGTIGEIIDPYLKGKIAPECFKVYVEVAQSCVRERGFQRPTMNDVKEKLNFALELQEDADAAKEKTNPGGQYSYPQVLSFPVANTSGVPRNSDIHSGDGVETDSGTWLSTTSFSDTIQV